MADAASRFGSASTLATTGTRGAVAGSARSSGASRSSAGFIRAQWNGRAHVQRQGPPRAERLGPLARALHRRGVARDDHLLSDR